MNAHKNYKLYINRKWVDSASGETLPTDNPTKPTQILGTFQKGNKEDIEKVVEAVEEALRSAR